MRRGGASIYTDVARSRDATRGRCAPQNVCVFVSTPSSRRPTVSSVLGATMMCWVATCTSRNRRCNALVSYTDVPPASVYIASTASTDACTACVVARRKSRRCSSGIGCAALRLVPGRFDCLVVERARGAQVRLGFRNLHLRVRSIHQRGRTAGAHFGRCERDQFVDCAARDAERHRRDAERKQRKLRELVQRSWRVRLDQIPDGVRLRHERVAHFVVETTGAAQAADMPRVEEMDLRRIEHEHVIARRAARRTQQLTVVADRAAAEDPLRILGSGAPLPMTVDREAARGDRGIAGWREYAADQRQRVVEDRARSVGWKSREHRAAGSADERDPAARCVRARERFEYLRCLLRRNFETAVVLRDEHPVEPGDGHLSGDVRRNSACVFDLACALRERRRQPPR